MLDIVTLNIDEASCRQLADAIDPLAGSLRFSGLIEIPAGSRYTAHMVEYVYRQSELVLEKLLGADFKEQIKAFGRGEADVLVLKGLPTSERFASYKPDDNQGMPYSELIYFGIARMLGAMSQSNLRLDYVRDGFDDNLHQDGAYRQPAVDYISYNQTNFLALSCLHPGEQKGVSTLFMSFDTVIQTLPERVTAELAKHNFVPKNGTEFRPLIIKFGERWVLNPEFASFNPFASGLMSSHGMMVRDDAAKSALDEIRKVFPPDDAPALRVNWEPGMLVIANQERVYHRRFAEGGIRCEQRLLARARIFRTHGVGDPDSNVMLTHEREFGNLGDEKLDLVRFEYRIKEWLGSREYAREVIHQRQRLEAWNQEVPRFSRDTISEHVVVQRPPTRNEIRNARMERILALP